MGLVVHKTTTTIWKFVLDIADEQTLFIPAGSIPLDVQVQGEELCLWAYVDTRRPPRKFKVYVYGTGNPVPHRPDQRYVGTVQVGNFVWHVYWEAP